MQRWLVLALAAVLAPHALHLPAWVAAFTFLLITWRLYRIERRQPPPGRWSMLPLTLAALIAVVVSHHTVFGREAGVTFVSLLAALKCLEMRTYRDGMVLVFLAWFLAFTQFLYAQGVMLATYIVPAMVLLTAAWIALHHQRAQPLPTLRRAAMLLVQALPVAALLFLLFPRIPGPLWGLPKDAYGAQSGLSEDMAPGSISRLILSGNVAFRVQFSGAPPANRDLYWRGPVLDEFDGRRWTAGWRIGAPPELEPLAPAVEYTVTLEPHGKRRLFALDLPAGIQDEDARIESDFQVARRSPVHSRLRYEVRSWLRYRMSAADSEEWMRARQLPADANPRALALGQTWRREAAGSPERVIDRALSLFRQEPFAYTLEPPRLGPDPVDDFLFRTRQGFCEHYASAFVTLMRAAGIPARVVTGYQGGEFNRFGGYLTVRQSDAHAWAEVWLGNQGWTRVDPTAAVSPERVRAGIDTALPLVAQGRGLFMADSAWMHTLRQSWDALNAEWNEWVLGFDQERQLEFFARLGFGLVSWPELGMGMAIGLSFLMAMMVLVAVQRPRTRTDPARACYQAFCRRMQRAGIARAPHEGPLDFARRISLARPELAEAVTRITALYVSLRYAPSPEAGSLSLLRNQVRAFRV
jgi:transglutaminase-like putative cysteine protease